MAIVAYPRVTLIGRELDKDQVQAVVKAAVVGTMALLREATQSTGRTGKYDVGLGVEWAGAKGAWSSRQPTGKAFRSTPRLCR